MPVHHIHQNNLGAQILPSVTSHICDSCLPAPWRGPQASFPAGFNQVVSPWSFAEQLCQSSTAGDNSVGWLLAVLGIPHSSPPPSVSALYHLSVYPQALTPLSTNVITYFSGKKKKKATRI